MKYTCPICDYPDLDEEPYYSYEICPVCYFESGCDDGGLKGGKDSAVRLKWLKELRRRWETDGRLWPQDPIRNPKFRDDIADEKS